MYIRVYGVNQSGSFDYDYYWEKELEFVIRRAKKLFPLIKWVSYACFENKVALLEAAPSNKIKEQAIWAFEQGWTIPGGKEVLESMGIFPFVPKQPTKTRIKQFESDFECLSPDGKTLTRTAHFDAKEAWRATMLAAGDLKNE